MSERIAQGLLLVLISLFVLTLSVCKAAPMTDYLPESEALTNGETQSLILSPSYREEVLRNLMTDQSSESDNVPYNTESLKRSGFKRMLSAAKRMALARRGGVALCLWKVCPAGPWLSRQ